MRHHVTTALVSAAVLFAGAARFAPAASADPGTVINYAPGATATRFLGTAFDTCTAPPVSAMRAWRASSYGAIGIYVGGVNRTCAQPNLTTDWVAEVARMGWRLMPVYMGLQPQCSSRTTSVKIVPSKAVTQGTTAAADAVKAVTALGLQPGSIVYDDVEHYDSLDGSCRKAVLSFVSGYTREMHRRGYLAGVYANLGSGVAQLAADYGSTVHARPDAIWAARWDGSRTLTGLTGVTDTQWSRYQRAKQYRGPHFETFGGVKLHVDSSYVAAPVATVKRTYRVTSAATARNGPAPTAALHSDLATGSLVDVMCQVQGEPVGGTPVWDKLTSGAYVSDSGLGTPSGAGHSSPIPQCFFAHQVVSPEGLTKRAGPGVSFVRHGELDDGALAWVTCQAAGSQIGSSKIWDQLDLGLFVADYYVTTPSRSTYSKPVPRCPSGT